MSSVPRTIAESFHDLLVFDGTTCWTKNVTGIASVYKPEGMVGKKMDQVRRESGELGSNDAPAFDKLNQAINSCQDLVRESVGKGQPPNRDVIVPVLVVPTGLLWQVDYDPDGTITALPRQVERVPFFLDHTWSARSKFNEPVSYRLSHVEIVTIGALPEVARNWLGPGGFFS